MFLPLHHFAFIFVWLPARRISGFVARRLVVSSFTAAAAFLAHHHKKAKLKRAAKQAAKKAAEQAKQTAWPAAWWPAAPPPMMAAHALPIAPVAAPEPHDWRVWLACLVPLLVRRLTELRAALLSAPATLGLPSLTVPSSISAHLPRLRLTEAFSSFSARPAVAAICILGLGCLALERLAVRNQRRARPQPAALASPSTPAEAPTEKAADFSDRATDTSEDALQWSPAAPTPQHEAGSAPLDSADDDETPIWLRQAESELHTPASLGQTHDQMRVYHDPPPTPMGEPRAPTEPSPMLFSHSTSENPLPVESHFLRRALAARNPNHDGLTFVRRKKGIFSGGDPAPNASPTSAGGQRSPGGATPTTPSTPDGKEAGAVSAHDQCARDSPPHDSTRQGPHFHTRVLGRPAPKPTRYTSDHAPTCPPLQARPGAGRTGRGPHCHRRIADRCDRCVARHRPHPGRSSQARAGGARRPPSRHLSLCKHRARLAAAAAPLLARPRGLDRAPPPDGHPQPRSHPAPPGLLLRPLGRGGRHAPRALGSPVAALEIALRPKLARVWLAHIPPRRVAQLVRNGALLKNGPLAITGLGGVHIASKAKACAERGFLQIDWRRAGEPR